MALMEWLVVLGIGILAKRSINVVSEEKSTYRQRSKEGKGKSSESACRADISWHRENTPCRFSDGITWEEFASRADKEGGRISRIRKLKVVGPIVYCTVESQTGYSKWDFSVDFNDWGHITGVRWLQTENLDSTIPNYLGSSIAEEIRRLLRNRNISLMDYSNYVDENKNLGTITGLSWGRAPTIIKRIFSKKRYVRCKFGSKELAGEHAYVVASLLKKNGFKYVQAVPIKDIDRNSNKFIYEVEAVAVSGSGGIAKGDILLENEAVVMTYHAKKEIEIPYSAKFFKRRNYIEVKEELYRTGFSNIRDRKIRDLTTEWIIKNGAVEQILVNVDGKEIPMSRGCPYEYDVEVIVTYHTFS